MAVSIGKDGTIHLTATTRLPLMPRRPKTTPIASKIEFTKTGLRLTATMPGIIAKKKPMVTTVNLSVADLVKIIRHKLKHGDPGAGEKLREALLAITPKNMAGWLKFFLVRLT